MDIAGFLRGRHADVRDVVIVFVDTEPQIAMMMSSQITVAGDAVVTHALVEKFECLA